MDAPTLIATLQEAVPGARLSAAPSIDLHTTLYAVADDVPALARALRDHDALRFESLIEITAVDYHPREPRYELIYILLSIERSLRLRLKVPLDGDRAHVATVTPVWPAANWLEREVWDMFGIVFDGHPDPRRLLMPEDWEGFPLRKDYPVQIRMTPNASEPLQMSEQEFRANVMKDRLTRHDA
jgi:NADH-quinone oxidoreductase subunit C